MAFIGTGLIKMCPVCHHELALLQRVSLKQIDDNALCYLTYLDKPILMSKHLICFLLLFLLSITLKSHLTWHNCICIALTPVLSLTK